MMKAGSKHAWFASMLIAGLVACGAAARRMTAPLSYAPVASAADESFRASPPAPQRMSLAPAVPVATASLENGVGLSLVERHGLPVFAARLVIARGARDVSRPTKMLDLAVGALIRAHETSSAAQTDLVPSADCQPDWCELAVSGRSSALERALAMLADLAMRPDYATQGAWLAQRAHAFLDELQGSAGAVTANAELSVLFPPGDAYAPPTVEERERVSRLRLNELAEAHTALFQPRHATLVVAGDVSLEQLRSAGARTFGAWTQAGPALAFHAEQPPRPGSPVRTVLVDFPSTLVHAYFVTRAPRPSDPAFDALAVLGYLLNTPDGALSEEVRSNQGASYSVLASLSGMRAGSVFSVGGAFEPDRAVSALSAVLSAVKTARDRGVEAEALEGARARAIASFRASTETVDGAADEVADALGNGTSPAEEAAREARLAAITASDIENAARAWLANEALRLVVVGPKQAIRNGFQDLGIGRVAWMNRRGELIEPPR